MVALLRLQNSFVHPLSVREGIPDMHSRVRFRAIPRVYNTQISRPRTRAAECAPGGPHARFRARSGARIVENDMAFPRHNGRLLHVRRRLRPQSHPAEFSCVRSEKAAAEFNRPCRDGRNLGIPNNPKNPHPSPCGHARHWRRGMQAGAPPFHRG